MGSGAALLDADGDGRLDIYLVNGRYTWEAQAPGRGADQAVLPAAAGRALRR